MNQKISYTKIFLKSINQTSEEEVNKHLKTLWYNSRKKDNGGLRLTEEGINFLTDVCNIKTYKIDFPPEFIITPQVLIYLDNHIESPYYINKKSITVLKEKAAFELYLFSGDIRKMGYNKALSNRLNQN